VGFIGDPFVRGIKEESKHYLASVFNFVNIYAVFSLE
jgi:amino acid permease